MRPPRLLLVLFCLIFFPIFLTFFSALSSPNVATPNTLAGGPSGLHALFSFNIPSSLFPPSAIISLTDDNSTFFLARPAAFGPLLPGKGLSGQLWVGSGFGEGGLAAGVEGELGCSDIPGWGEDSGHKQPDSAPRGTEQKSGKSGSGTLSDIAPVQGRSRLSSQVETTRQNERGDAIAAPSLNDGTDDHLHHPLPESDPSESGTTQKPNEYAQIKHSTHADIQSLQETAEIQGKVVLLSRGGCGFLEKVKWAQRRGAVALIVGDDTRGGNLVTMYARGDTSNVTIPAIFTSHTTAHLLSSLVPSHTGSSAKLGDTLRSVQSRLTGQIDQDSQKAAATTSVAPTSVPTSTSSSATKERSSPSAKQGVGFFRMVGSFFGLCRKTGSSGHVEDSRRPPSSGNLDWMMLGSWDSAKSHSGRSKSLTDSQHSRNKVADTRHGLQAGLVSDNLDGDGFVIGVQDWRDPDLMPPRSSTTPSLSSTNSGKDSSKTAAPDAEGNSAPNILRGGSITPSSGEYQSVDKSNGNVYDSSVEDSTGMSRTSSDGSQTSSKGWFSSHFGWGDDDDVSEAEPSSSSSLQNVPASHMTQQKAASSSSPLSAIDSEHEGLWVTLTPTSMSASPFFDTLLILVISPLLTLTVVYALLLLRSRIRRRRWRAPKSIVERLPVRTYHTISSASSTNSLRPSSPTGMSPTSPLLGECRSSTSRPSRSRSQTIAGTTLNSAAPREEKSTSLQSGSTLWRRKYFGKQVECVVCLEEYIDGQSKVMSLPCGHEFHAECM